MIQMDTQLRSRRKGYKGFTVNRQDYQITSWCRRMIREHVQSGDLCIDATMGNGNDTEYLCMITGAKGRVIAFDIQEEAVLHTKKRLQEKLSYCNYELLLDSHCHMDQYAASGTVSCIVFNLGYLPGGDHKVATKAETTIAALEQGLLLLKQGGVMSVCIYSGGDSGFEEKDAVLGWMKGLDPKNYLVLVTEYYNRPNHPPIPALIIRL